MNKETILKILGIAVSGCVLAALFFLRSAISLHGVQTDGDLLPEMSWRSLFFMIGRELRSQMDIEEKRQV